MNAAVSAHAGDVRRWIHGAGVRDQDVESAVGEVLAELCLAFDDLPTSQHREFLRAAAHRVAKTLDAELARSPREGRTRDVVSHEPARAAEDTLAAELDSRRAGAYLIGALNVLPRTERTLFVNARWLGKSRTQIASELGMPRGSVTTRLRRAETLLEQALRKLQEQDRRSLALRPGPLPAWAAPGRRQPGVEVVSRAEAMVRRGPWLFVNNQWARARARGLFDQCLLFRRSAPTSAGWSWSWPRQPGLPLAFPQAIYGRSPWRECGATDPRFPMPTHRLRALQLDYDVRTTALGEYTLLLVVYLVEGCRSYLEITPPAISTELTLLLDHRGDTAPVGAVLDTPLLDGVRYDVRRVYPMGGPELLGYPALFFKPRLPRRSGRIDLLGMLRYCEHRRWIGSSLAVTSIEFGNEVHGGAGTTWLERLELTVDAA